MEPTVIIKKPLITEKSTYGNEHNRYAFHVDRRASKDQIRHAVETIYKVRVIGVNTMIRKGRLRRSRHGYWKPSDRKHAIVKVHPDDKIELF